MHCGHNLPRRSRPLAIWSPVPIRARLPDCYIASQRPRRVHSPACLWHTTWAGPLHCTLPFLTRCAGQRSKRWSAGVTQQPVTRLSHPEVSGTARLSLPARLGSASVSVSVSASGMWGSARLGGVSVSVFPPQFGCASVAGMLQHLWFWARLCGSVRVSVQSAMLQHLWLPARLGCASVCKRSSGCKRSGTGDPVPDGLASGVQLLRDAVQLKWRWRPTWP